MTPNDNDSADFSIVDPTTADTIVGPDSGTIVVNGDIRIQVLEVRGRTVRIGIEAPEDQVILRGELTEWRDLSFGEPAKSDESTLSCCAK